MFSVNSAMIHRGCIHCTRATCQLIVFTNIPGLTYPSRVYSCLCQPQQKRDNGVSRKPGRDHWPTSVSTSVCVSWARSSLPCLVSGVAGSWPQPSVWVKSMSGHTGTHLQPWLYKLSFMQCSSHYMQCCNLIISSIYRFTNVDQYGPYFSPGF